MPIVGTVVTGAPRTGTTLAFAIQCELYEDEFKKANEPEVMSHHVGNFKAKEAEEDVRKLLADKGIIKSPPLTFLLPFFQPDFNVILTFRDFRTFLPSITTHKNSRSVFGDKSSWKQYAGRVDTQDLMKMDWFDRALGYFRTAYACAVRYRGPMQVWSYGFWDEWKATNPDPMRMFRGMSERVAADLAGKPRFSDASFSLENWQAFKSEKGLSDKCDAAIAETHSFLKSLYAQRGVTLRILEDRAT